MYEDLISWLRRIAALSALCEKAESCEVCDAAEACEEFKVAVISENTGKAADAIEELTGFLQEAERDRDEYRERLDKSNDAIEELMRRCEQFQYMPLPAWFPVTEEPPLSVGDDGYNGYLVYVNGYYAVADYTTDKLDDVPSFHVNGEYEPDVTHYMPLPAPPKEEG